MQVVAGTNYAMQMLLKDAKGVETQVSLQLFVPLPGSGTLPTLSNVVPAN